jgi:hypothetical protein
MYAPYAIADGNPDSAYASAMTVIAQIGVRFPLNARRITHNSAG